MHLLNCFECSITHVNMFDYAHIFSNINCNFVEWGYRREATNVDDCIYGYHTCVAMRLGLSYFAT